MNRKPLVAVTDREADIYARDGVVCLRKVIDQDWVEKLRTVALDAWQHPEKFGLLPTTRQGRYLSRVSPEFRDYALNSPIGEACGKVLRSRFVRFYFDELVCKPAKSTTKTVWHNDRSGWPVAGQMLPTLWMALTPVARKDCLECLAGSQNDDTLYWIFSPNAKQMMKPDDRPTHPDIESLRDDPSYTFLSLDMEPCDVLLFHPWTLHYNSGNSSDDWRIAITTRLIGDDIRWAPRPDCLNFAGVSFDEMIPGEPPVGPMFPVIWSEDGERESGEDFPTGFATAWSDEAYARLAEATQPKGGLEKYLKDRGGPQKPADSIKVTA